MEINGRNITNVGIFQTGKGMMIVGAYFIIISICLIAVACVQIFFGDTLVAIPLLAAAGFLLFVAISNIIVVSRLKSRNFTEGKTCEITVLDSVDKHTKYVAFIGSDGRSSNHADTVSDGPKDV